VSAFSKKLLPLFSSRRGLGYLQKSDAPLRAKQ
jgi:hypothetical protein